MRFSVRHLLLVTAIIAVVLAICCILIPQLKLNSVAIKNEFRHDITDIELTLSSMDNTWMKTWKVDSLAPGEVCVFEHDHNDTYALVHYKINGKLNRHEHGYIDLWRGEQWVFYIDAEGQLQSKYGYPKLTRSAGKQSDEIKDAENEF